MGFVNVTGADAESDAQHPGSDNDEAPPDKVYEDAAENEGLCLGSIIPDHLPAGVLAGTDVGGAHLLVHHHGQDLRHSTHVGWLCWDGRRFVAEGKDASRISIRVQNIGRRLKLGASELFQKAALATDEAEQQRLRQRANALFGWAKHVQSAKGIRNIIELARTLVPVHFDKLDSDPWLLNCENGTVDLRTGELREHRRSDLITKLAPVSFDAQAQCLLWNKFVAEILPDEDVRSFVQRYLGYALTGITREQCFVVALGPGANGKSVLAETVRSVLGDYTRDSPTDTFMHTSGSRGTENDIARLRGARFVTAKETEEGKRLDEARVKQLTGEDTVTARFLFLEHFEFIPSFKLWLYCNHRPTIVGVDDGIWRRVLLVPFEVIIPKDDRDTELKDKLLAAEAPGILAWLVRGCVEWQQSGLRPPEAVTAGTAEWRAASNDVKGFLEDCCEVNPHAKAEVGQLSARYQAWSKTNNKTPLSNKEFKQRMEKLGYSQIRTSDARFWGGVRMLPDSQSWHG